MQYKPGDIVTVRKDLAEDSFYRMYDSSTQDTATEQMVKYAGGNIQIEETRFEKYRALGFWWTDEMLVPRHDTAEDVISGLEEGRLEISCANTVELKKTIFLLKEHGVQLGTSIKEYLCDPEMIPPHSTVWIFYDSVGGIELSNYHDDEIIYVFTWPEIMDVFKKTKHVEDPKLPEAKARTEHEGDPTPPETKVKPDKTTKEEAKMNILGINMEYGPNTDPNIASTFLGTAVKVSDTWRIYDKKEQKLVDVGSTELGSLPIFLIPSRKVSAGDMIKRDGKYYYVVESKDGKTEMISAETGKVETVLPITGILGGAFYTKVVPIADKLLDDDSDGRPTKPDVETDAADSGKSADAGKDAEKDKLLALMLISNAMKECGKADGESGEKSKNMLPMMLSMLSIFGEQNSKNLKLAMLLQMQTPGAGGMESILPALMLSGAEDLF